MCFAGQTSRPARWNPWPGPISARPFPEGFVFTRDGRYLYGSSYYTGVSNIFRFELATGELEAVSNAETGFFRPIPMADGTLIVQEYTGDGFAPTIIEPKPLDDVSAITFLGAQIANKHPIVKEWVVGPPEAVDLESMITRRGKYRPMRELEYGDGYPIVEGYRDSAALGWHVRLADPAQFHRLDISASYSWDDELPSDEKPHVNVRYETPVWRWEYWHNGADFYDLFGPTKRSRKGDAFLGEYNKALIYDDPRRLDLSILGAYFTGLDTLPVNQNVPSDFDEIVSGQVELDYTDTRSSQRFRGSRKRLSLGTRRQRRQGRRRYRVQAARRPRFRLRASARKLVRVAVQRRRRRERQPGECPGQLLLRRIRQQLCR